MNSKALVLHLFPYFRKRKKVTTAVGFIYNMSFFCTFRPFKNYNKETPSWHLHVTTGFLRDHFHCSTVTFQSFNFFALDSFSFLSKMNAADNWWAL